MLSDHYFSTTSLDPCYTFKKYRFNERTEQKATGGIFLKTYHELQQNLHNKGYRTFVESEDMIFMGLITPKRFSITKIYKKENIQQIDSYPRELFDGLLQMHGESR